MGDELKHNKASMKMMEYFKQTGISQAEFARRIGAGQSYIFHVANGHTLPGVMYAHKIHKMLRAVLLPDKTAQKYIRSIELSDWSEPYGEGV